MTKITAGIEAAKERANRWQTDTHWYMKSRTGAVHDAKYLNTRQEDQLSSVGIMEEELDEFMNKLGLEALRGGF